MDIGVYSIKTISDADFGKLLDNHVSFTLEEIDPLHMDEAVETLEKKMADRSLKCRVYTKGRAASMGAMGAVAVPPVFLFGLVAAVGIAAHNVATWNPDYEIGKNLVTGTLSVTYKK